MIQKKICLIGSFAVGKTSLVSRFVQSLFSEKYLTTVGVKVDKKVVEVDGTSLTLMLWDIEGEDEFQRLVSTYLRGMSGYLLVADGTRRASFDKALELQARVSGELGALPFVLVLNKHDLAGEWDLGERDLRAIRERGWRVRLTSAKTGAGVEDAFQDLARSLVPG